MASTTAAAPTIRPLSAAAHGEKNLTSLAFLIALWLCLAFGIAVLLVLLFETFQQGRPRLDAELFTNYTSVLFPEQAGARAAILGSAWVIVTTAGMAIPLGVAAAAYLEEFASRENKFARFVELNVQNLAAVPA
ncbi:MAG: phosphate ABC transporter permease PstA, partial [Actinomycetota bacterium]